MELYVRARCVLQGRAGSGLMVPVKQQWCSLVQEWASLDNGAELNLELGAVCALLRAWPPKFIVCYCVSKLYLCFCFRLWAFVPRILTLLLQPLCLTHLYSSTEVEFGVLPDVD